VRSHRYFVNDGQMVELEHNFTKASDAEALFVCDKLSVCVSRYKPRSHYLETQFKQ
jgi:hypothetical protein